MIAVLILAETNDFARSIIGERLPQAVPVTPRIRSCRDQRGRDPNAATERRASRAAQLPDMPR
jgi:hypothetical protein